MKSQPFSGRCKQSGGGRGAQCGRRNFEHLEQQAALHRLRATRSRVAVPTEKTPSDLFLNQLVKEQENEKRQPSHSQDEQ